MEKERAADVGCLVKGEKYAFIENMKRYLDIPMPVVSLQLFIMDVIGGIHTSDRGSS